MKSRTNEQEAPPVDCPRCGGGGEVVERGLSHNPYCGFPTWDPQEDVGHRCDFCHGEGVVHELAAQAYELGWC